MTLPTFSTNEHGFATATVAVPVGEREVFSWYARVVGWLLITHQTSVVWEGVAEDFDPAGPLVVTAYGAYVALSDLPYTALWSSSKTSEWQPTTNRILAGRNPERWSMDTNNRIYLAPNGGDAQDTSNIGSISTAIPHGSSRQLLAISYDYSWTAPNSTWQAVLERRADDYTGAANVWTISGNGATQTGSQAISLTACDRLMFSSYFNRAATTLGTAVAAGGVLAKVCTPGSMSGIVKGSKLAIGGVEPEEVEVTAVTATTFTADYRWAHTTADAVSIVWEGETDDVSLIITNLRIKTTASAAVYADEIVKDLIAATTAVNASIVSSSTILVQSPAIDLYNETFEDMYPSDIINHLLAYGDSAGRMWECAVWDGRRVQLQVRGSRGRTWYFDSTPAIERQISRLWNSMYAVYSDEEGRTLRSSVSSNAISVFVYGRTRRQAIAVNTTSLTQATASRDVALNDSLITGNAGDIPLDAIYDNVGNWYPGYLARAGDIFVARNLPVGISAAVDATRSFRCAATSYDANSPDRPLTITAELRGPRFAAYEARRGNIK